MKMLSEASAILRVRTSVCLWVCLGLSVSVSLRDYIVLSLCLQSTILHTNNNVSWNGRQTIRMFKYVFVMRAKESL